MDRGYTQDEKYCFRDKFNNNSTFYDTKRCFRIVKVDFLKTVAFSLSRFVPPPWYMLSVYVT